MRRREFLAAGATATLITSTNVLPITRPRVFGEPRVAEASKLTPPADVPIPVAFAISRGATMIDFAGPWEVFQDVMVPAKAQAGSPALHAWLRKIVDSTDVTMSVCTGAFQLGRAGLLNGQEATTHHDFFEQFAKAFPDVKLKRGLRFVENQKISTAGGLTSGIDLALRVVERYFGREMAEQTAVYMEYQSRGWVV